ncbi:MAG: hypothetical protein ACMUIP_15290 [bacterium]
MKKINFLAGLFFFVLLLLLVTAPVTQAQNWIELPPYNTLWPLWSPALSPINAVTGLPTPIVSSLSPDTTLPVMPALTWDPSIPYPWLLYNTLQGMAYFDPLAGINLWPAPSLLDSSGAASPLALPADYANLPPTDATWLANNVSVANNSFLLSYPSFLPAFAGPAWLNIPPALSNLLTPLDLLGPVLGAPSVLAPAPVIPAPTVAAAPATTVLVAEQAGTWLGTWYLGFLFGDMSMVLVQNSTTGYLSGTVTLSGNLALGVPIEVFGTATAGSIDISGIDPSGSLALNINGILISPTEMTGTWTVIATNTGAVVKNGVGNFEVTLVDTVSFTAPTIVPVAPAPTTLAPVPTVPVLPVPTPTVAVAPAPITAALPVPTVAIPTAVAPTAAISQLVPLAPFVIAEQSGTWDGFWSAGLYSGPMSLNLTEIIDPLLGTSTLVGYAQLLGNPILPTLIDNISGEVLNNQIYVTGSGLGAGSTNYTIEIVGTLTSATTMVGTYTLIGTSNSIKEVGSFDLSLLPSII